MKINLNIKRYLAKRRIHKSDPEYKSNRELEKWLRNYETDILEIVSQQLDFINHQQLKANFTKLLSEKPSFVLRLYSLAIWKKVFSVYN
jgi:hypothetical protein